MGLLAKMNGRNSQYDTVMDIQSTETRGKMELVDWMKDLFGNSGRGPGLLIGLLLNSPPCLFHMLATRVGLSHTHPKCEFTVQIGVREVEVTGAIEAVHEGLVGGVS